VESNRRARVQGFPALRDQLLIERLVEPVILARTAVQILVHERRVRCVQDGRQIQLVRLPMLGGTLGVQRPDLSDHLVDRTEAQLRHQFPDFLRDEQEEVLDELGLAVETLTQQRVLGRDTDRTGVEVTHPHHDAAGHHQGRGGEAEFLATQQRGDDHVAAGLELAVDLHHDPVAQAVQPQHLLRLGEPELPRHAAVLDGRERRRTRPAVVTRDQHDVGVRFRDAGGDGAHAHFGDELHTNTRLVVGVLEVVDQLR